MTQGVGWGAPMFPLSPPNSAPISSASKAPGTPALHLSRTDHQIQERTERKGSLGITSLLCKDKSTPKAPPRAKEAEG